MIRLWLYAWDEEVPKQLWLEIDARFLMCRL